MTTLREPLTPDEKLYEKELSLPEPPKIPGITNIPKVWFPCPFCGIFTSRLTNHDHLFGCPVCKIMHSIKGNANGKQCEGIVIYMKELAKEPWWKYSYQI